MRCKNCGWENPQGREKCEKCNAPLQAAPAPPVPPIAPAPHVEPNPLKGTLPENQLFGNTCKHCGYPIAPGFRVCPNCGEPVAAAAPAQPATSVAPVPPPAPARPGTINPWDTPQESHFCTLQPIAWHNEQIEYTPVSYSGDQVVLNRANTDPNNQSITSKEQAVLSFENGEWYLEDKSEQKTTFVHAGRKTKLESGDIIILGNRRFIFKG